MTKPDRIRSLCSSRRTKWRPAISIPASQLHPGPTIHLAVAEPIEEAMERVTENGGKVVSPVIQIPAGRFAYCLDPDGNSFGLFV